jgi:hypothetical protein
MLRVRDLFQDSPEGLFKADAGLVSTNHDGTFNDRGFHSASRPESAAGRVLVFQRRAENYTLSQWSDAYSSFGKGDVAFRFDSLALGGPDSDEILRYPGTASVPAVRRHPLTNKPIPWCNSYPAIEQRIALYHCHANRRQWLRDPLLSRRTASPEVRYVFGINCDCG